jgi:hypothetical protein
MQCSFDPLGRANAALTTFRLMAMRLTAVTAIVQTTLISNSVSVLLSSGLMYAHSHSIVVKECEAFDGEGVIRFRSYRDDKQPEFVGETIDTPVGTALLEWNSRLRLPCDT